MQAAAGLRIPLPDLAATRSLAARLAARARTGDAIALDGPLGVGKTEFARAFIRRLAGADIEVPSPTFNLVLTYSLPPATVWHFDLYRVERPGELEELGFDEALREGISLIEWPDRLGARLPADALTVKLSPGRSPESREATLWPGGDWPGRLA